MNEERLEALIKGGIDSISPPPGAKQRILEGILKEQDNSRSDSGNTVSHTSQFSIIEDKRSDIAPPQETEQEKDKEKELFALSEGEKQKGAVVRQHSRYFYILGAVAACAAVAVLGAFVFGFLGSQKNKLETDSTAASEMKDKIFSDNSKSIFTYLCKDDEDEAGVASHVYTLDSYTLIWGSENGTALLDTNGNELARTDKKIEGNYLREVRPYNPNSGLGSGSLGFAAYEYTEDPDVDGKNTLTFCCYDLETLKEVAGTRTVINMLDYAVNAKLISCGVVGHDVLSKDSDFEFDTRPEGDDANYQMVSYIFTIRYYNKKGHEESALYIIRPGAKKAKKLIAVNNELMQKIDKDRDNDETYAYYIEAAWADQLETNPEYDGNIDWEGIHFIYSRVPMTPDGYTNMYKKTYYYSKTPVLDPELSAGMKITEEDAASPTQPFSKSYQIEDTETNYILNREQGNMYIIYLDARAGGLNPDTEYAVTDQDWEGAFAMYSLGYQQSESYPDMTELYDGELITQELWDKLSSEGKLENLHNDPLYSVKEIERVYPSECLAKTSYSELGEPIETRIYMGMNMNTCYAVPGQAINVSDGLAFIDFKSKTVHTASGVYKLEVR